MEPLIIIVLLILIYFLIRNNSDEKKSCVQKKYYDYKPVSLDKFIESPQEDVKKIPDEVEIDFSKNINSVIPEDGLVYDMFINKELDSNLSEDRLFKSKLVYDYRNMDSIEKAVKNNNYHHMTQRYTL